MAPKKKDPMPRYWNTKEAVAELSGNRPDPTSKVHVYQKALGADQGQAAGAAPAVVAAGGEAEAEPLPPPAVGAAARLPATTNDEGDTGSGKLSLCSHCRRVGMFLDAVVGTSSGDQVYKWKCKYCPYEDPSEPASSPPRRDV